MSGEEGMGLARNELQIMVITAGVQLETVP